MIEIENVISALESTFLVQFEYEKKTDSIYIIKFNESERALIQCILTIKNELRIVLLLEPEKYAANFLKLINQSSVKQRQDFCEIWKKIGTDKVLFKVNDNILSPEQFMLDSSVWKSFSIKINLFPFFENPNSKNENIGKHTVNAFGLILKLFEYGINGFNEGNFKESLSTKFERDYRNREICLLLKGYNCAVCDFNFEKKYGHIGNEFIEVHHIIPVSQMELNHIVDPKNELVPLCSNCHSMIHRRNPPFSIEEMKLFLK